ncbi:FAD-dependent oxidoreductase [Gymnodinialimonas sp. 2305UL16-5]|uniref:FAD-dependent oxidoreductase n=1 Tax=Gymnodinialimonas mytili TaxID=3126503 RepID=UPI0030B48A8B
MPKPRIVILGGGFGGLYTARALRREFGDGAEIELVTAENYFVFQPLLPEVGAGSVTPIHATSPFRFLLKHVRVRKAIVDSVDFDAKTVTVFQGVQRRPTEISYDHLVIALGQVVDLSRTPGLAPHALTMKSLEDARRLRGHVIERLEHADITNLPEVKRGALTFTVIGGGFSGIETVGEMAELIDRSLKYYPNVSRDEIRIIVLEFADKILAEMPDTLRAYAQKQLEKRGVEIRLNTGIASATGTQITTTAGDLIDTRTVVATIGNAPAPVVARMDLPLTQGRIAVARDLSVPDRGNVWSLGDCALIPMKDGAEARGDFAPPTAQFAVREAKQLAANIARAARAEATRPFAYTSKGAMASLGARRGVADVMGVRLTGFLAWLLWRAYYVAFLPGFPAKVWVLSHWVLDWVTPRSLVNLKSHTPPAARHIHYRAGDRIYEQGNRADGFYTVIEGAVEITTETPQPGQPASRRVGPGGHFGERMVLGATRRVATARAAEDTIVMVLDREEFMKLADAIPPFRSYFEDHLTEKGLDWPETAGRSNAAE